MKNLLSHFPIIDLNQEEQGENMLQACMEHGFFYIDNRQGQEVDIQLVEELERKSQKFFQLPSSVKNKYAIEKSKSHRGYISVSSENWFYESGGFQPTLKENLFFASPSFLEKVGERGKKINDTDRNIYPLELGSEFELMIKQYVQKCWTIKDKILKHLAPYLDMQSIRNSKGLIREWKDAFSEPLWNSRLLCYLQQDKITLPPHTDRCVLTILHQAQKGGLQIWFKEQWVSLPPIKNTFMVNIGDVLQEWSAGLLKSTRHQVVYEGDSARYSLPFFVHLSKDCEIYSKSQNKWILHYQHLIQRQYNMYTYLREKVKNPSDCLEGMSSKEIDAFYQKVII
jgi:isopenicillin N synthase-like dioxygenase